MEWSRPNLDYSKKDESLKKLSAAIIFNFCGAYRTTTAFPRSGIVAMTSIVLGSIESKDTIAAQTFLVHISKRGYHPVFFTHLVSKAKMFAVTLIPSDDEKEWMKLAKKVLCHTKIQSTINDCIVDYCDVESIELDEIVEEATIKVTFLRSSDPTVRGFAGFGEFFINSYHFQEKFRHFGESIELLQVIAKMDIISLTVHELAHINIRKHLNDFNLHTPCVAQQKGLAGQQHEFGIYVDWFGSFYSLVVEHAESFINAIEKNIPWPSSCISGIGPRLGNSNVDGVDMEQNIRQDTGGLLYVDEYYKSLLRSYFRLDVDLKKHYEQWSAAHSHFRDEAARFYAIRMLDQEPVENLFSFICSQNNHITRISSLIEKLCSMWRDSFDPRRLVIEQSSYKNQPPSLWQMAIWNGSTSYRNSTTKQLIKN
ncbi:hypothetical protein HA402_000383 [Bradysia odoriphaga]|nr:hypothetical protein HA402_000383 [Bradysia odoriphaga]